MPSQKSKKPSPFLLNYSSGYDESHLNPVDMDFKNLIKSKRPDIDTSTDNFDKHLLIFTRIGDSETTVLGPKLLAEGINYTRIDAEYVIDHFSVSCEMISGKFNVVIQYFDEVFNINDIDLCWYRHFTLDALNLEGYSELEKKYIQNQWQIVMDFLVDYPNLKWIENPHSIAKTSKPAQFFAAQQFNITTIDTLISNNSQLIDNYIRMYSEGIYAKSINHHYVELEANKLYTVFGKSLNSLDINPRETSCAPTIFQPIQPDLVEARVAVVSSEMFGVSYQKYEEDDWHREGMDNINVQKINIPEDIQNKIKKLMEYFDLTFAGVDFFIDSNDKWKLIEINPRGDWLWIENRSGHLITNAVSSVINKKIKEDTRQKVGEANG